MSRNPPRHPNCRCVTTIPSPQREVFVLTTCIKVCDQEGVIDYVYSYDEPGIAYKERCRGHNTGRNADLILEG
jgi:hypothetical protein